MSVPTPETPFDIRYAGVKGDPQPRKNIITFSEEVESGHSSKQWYLFLWSLSVFQGRKVTGTAAEKNITLDIKHPLSYYQVVGIHGLPYLHWLEKPEPEDRPGMYCTHGTALFLTWHRPYLLLFEQCLVDTAVKLANTLPAGIAEKYKEEAQKIRLPYWDWATDSDFPKILWDRKIDILLPVESETLKKITVDSPLYSYELKDDLRRKRDFNLLGIQTISDYTETKRCPDAKGVSHPEIIGEQIRGNESINPPGGGGIRNGIYKLLTTVANYGRFSNTGWRKSQPPPPDPDSLSLESFHNAIHNYIGSNFKERDPKDPRAPKILGHMTAVEVSGFDPSFWLHHSNIDRLYALWQCLHYESDFEAQAPEIYRLPPPPQKPVGRDFIADDESDTTLRPFRFKDDNGKYELWTNRDVQKPGRPENLYPSVLDYNYYYPEMKKAPVNREDQRSHVNTEVRKLYGPPIEGDERLGSQTELSGHYFGSHEAKIRVEWMVSFRVRKYLVKENFVIFFFIGKPEEDSRNWVTSSNLAGSFHTFKSRTEYCANCLDQEEADADMFGGVDLTDALHYMLKQKGKKGTSYDDSNEEKNAAGEWLTDNLEWRILKDDGAEIKHDSFGPEGFQYRVGRFDMFYLTGAKLAPQDPGFADEPTREDHKKVLDSVQGFYKPKEYTKAQPKYMAFLYQASDQ